ncbi:hypothetical protein [Nonomuraea longicatena]|uniref:Uncharacterized protein n=1 Tax=Nonomuraea longicatena TaxID=83682 RepID=A0ABN1QWR8_9ACTN
MAVVDTRADEIKETDWRFAELVMRAWTDPQLAERYRVDPVGTLARFGIAVAGPHEAPELGIDDEVRLEIEPLDHPREQAAALPSFR